MADHSHTDNGNGNSLQRFLRQQWTPLNLVYMLLWVSVTVLLFAVVFSWLIERETSFNPLSYAGPAQIVGQGKANTTRYVTMELTRCNTTNRDLIALTSVRFVDQREPFLSVPGSTSRAVPVKPGCHTHARSWEIPNGISGHWSLEGQDLIADGGKVQLGVWSSEPFEVAADVPE